MSLIISFFLFFIPLYSYSYERNPYVSEEIWQEVEPFFLPEKHFLKKKLDKIFLQNKRVTANVDSLVLEGFIPTPIQGTVCLALKHINFPEYVFKIFTDDRKTRVDWQSWVKRVKGAERIKKAIKKFHYSTYFKVPKKWIYPLPPEPSPSEIKEGERKNFILVVENMHPLSKEKNWNIWRNRNDANFIKRIMKIALETGAGDIIRANNSPFCEDGRQAFLDTERTNTWPIDFHPMKEFLNPQMRIVLKELIKRKGGEGNFINKPEKK